MPHLKREAKYKPNSLRLVTAALRFLFRRMLGRDWPVLELASAPPAHRLPVALIRQQLAKPFAFIRMELCQDDPRVDSSRRIVGWALASRRGTRSVIFHSIPSLI